MRSRYLRELAAEERKLRSEELRRDCIIESLCDIISSNRENLEAELSKIIVFLRSAEDVGICYNEKDKMLVYWQIKESEKQLENIVYLDMVAKKVEEINGEAVNEFFGGVDFFNFADNIKDKSCKLESIMYIWRAQTVIKDIKYQFERIWNSSSKHKKIAILKAMVAYD